MSDAFIIRRGGGKPRRLDIIKDGRIALENASLSVTVNDPGHVSADWSYGSGSLNLDLGGWSNGTSQAYFSLNRPIDLGPYSGLYLDIRQQKSKTGSMGVQSSPGWSGDLASSSLGANTSRQIVSLDVSGISGMVHPFVHLMGFGTGQGNGAYIYNFWLER